MIFKRKLKEYTNVLPKSNKLNNKIVDKIPIGKTDNLQGYIDYIKELKDKNEKLENKLKGEYWIDNQRFDLEKDKEKIIEILSNNIRIIARGRLGNIRIHDSWTDECYLLHDTLTNKRMKISKEKIDE